MRIARLSRLPSAFASMSPPVKSASIIGGAIVLSTALWVYCSPYHTCVRAMDGKRGAESMCARFIGGAP